LLDLHRNYRITGIPLVRYASTNETAADKTVANETTVIETVTNETPPQSSPYDEIPGLYKNIL